MWAAYAQNLGLLHWVVLVAQSFLTLCDPTDCSHLAPLSLELSRQEYWSELPFPSSRDLPNPEIEPEFPALQADSLLLSHQVYYYYYYSFVLNSRINDYPEISTVFLEIMA